MYEINPLGFINKKISKRIPEIIKHTVKHILLLGNRILIAIYMNEIALGAIKIAPGIPTNP
jgi:hypothetical protein